MAGLQEEKSQTALFNESDDEIEKISLGVRTKFQLCSVSGGDGEGSVKSNGKVSKHFRPVHNEHSSKNKCVTHYVGPNRIAKCSGNKVLGDGKMTLVADDTRFVVDRTIFDSRPNTMLGRYVLRL